MADIELELAPEQLTTEELCALYAAVGWTIYAENPPRQRAAVDGSSFVATARVRIEGATLG